MSYNAAEMVAGAPNLEPLTDKGALEIMTACREGVDFQEKSPIGGYVQKKQTAG